MRRALQHLRDDEQGMSFAFVGFGFLAFFAATALAIDVGLFMTARSQAQTAADAGALAGATALVFNDFNDHSPGGPAVLSAVNTAIANKVGGEVVDVDPSDVTFHVGTGGLTNQVQVDVFRSADRGNPLGTLIGKMLGVDAVDIRATATAEASPANAMTCVKPFTIPDRWIENNVPPNDTFDRYDKKGNVLPDADVYVPPGPRPPYAGYDPRAGGPDIGTVLKIRAGLGNQVESSFYWSWKMPGDVGGDFYRDNISGCNPTMISMPYMMTQEPGTKVGETVQGIDLLLAADTSAYWDGKQVQSTMSPSPRVFPIPLYDPDYYQDNMTHGRNADLKMVNWVGFFLENRNGSDVYGRIVPITGHIDPSAGPAPEGAFPMAIRLVK